MYNVNRICKIYMYTRTLVSTSDFEDDTSTVSDVITEVDPAQVIENDIICSRSHANKSCDEVTENEASVANRRRSLQKKELSWLEKVV